MTKYNYGKHVWMGMILKPCCLKLLKNLSCCQVLEDPDLKLEFSEHIYHENSIHIWSLPLTKAKISVEHVILKDNTNPPAFSLDVFINQLWFVLLIYYFVKKNA